MRTFQLHLASDIDDDLAWSLLEERGIVVLFATQDEEGAIELVINTDFSEEKLLEDFPFITSCFAGQLPDMDYAAEWEKHALHFHEGKVQLPCGDKTLFLQPGAGFGDLSHPTTRLCLDLMEGRVEGKTIIDIGSGSGVLALAALVFGARQAVGIDIDPKAIDHARENALLNQLQDQAQFVLAESFQNMAVLNDPVIFMNMILSEQAVAWENFKRGRQGKGTLIVSGILEEQEAEFKQFARLHNWKVVKLAVKEGWLASVVSFNFLH